MQQVYKEFSRFLDIYYWRTALMIARNSLSRQYRNSFLGVMWTLVQPITMVMVYSFVMPMIMKIQTSSYVLYIVTSLPLWAFISNSLIAASYSLISQGETLKRCMVSSTVFPVADVMKQFYIYAISFVVIYAMAVMLIAPFSWTILLVPLYLLPILVIVTSLSVAVSFMAPFVRDIGEALMMAMNVMVWLTPVFYPITMVPDWLRPYMEWNPFYIMMHPIQVLAYERALPSPEADEHLLMLMVVSVAVGYAVYRRCRKNFVYYL